MSDLRDLGQRYFAALWDAVGTLDRDAARTVDRLGGLVAAVTEAEAQLAGLRLHLMHEAKLAAAEAVIDGVRQSVRTTPAQATASLRLAQDLCDRFPLIGAALNDGSISLAQADAIVTGLRKLPARLTRAELTRCEQEILQHVDTLGPPELRVLAARLVEVIDPDASDADDAKRLAREEAAAHRGRFLRLAPDYHGSMRITGQLPVADAALLTAQLDALMPDASTYTSAGEAPSRDARRADALVLLTEKAANTGALPRHGGDRPQVHVTLDLDTLTIGLGKAGLIGVDDVNGLSPGEVRRLACDAAIIPVVLGGPSRLLDVGRTYRTFTPGLRAALLQRDGGCAFPGCTATPACCEAHHIVPWWQGGDTRLGNGVLLCPHHHRLVEPDPLQSKQSQWRVDLDPVTGLPWFTPPRHIDPARRPRQHRRFRLQQIRAGAPPCPDDDPPDTGPPEVDPPETEVSAADRPDLDDLIRRSAHIWGDGT
ncbi:hypothetical protein BCR15_10145 [Tessaracoccus lapidicaptus]|uniref:Uncharacterized protein n=1 Tax=Tessaracoccus lapidicaptus TaxID=1427523 RepID=A0A1C0AGJ5_9ACTN|nr:MULTISPECIES: HNH endonuclease signature motif containing protein [Tessaracoccus]AQX14925.1 HNH endonuclease [Tessaracoccus sp. T2.5-30]OCL30831.1 hypothetical protein BCR15_10145 [Tessaracoccus lapidicaptus]VEP39086.1 hypothetical protein TLA_TLA_00513 [Tessaracoccus lapidicaptus]